MKPIEHNLPISPLVLQEPRCALCHTVDRTITSEELAAGTGFCCVRCGQQWTGDRLKTATDYARTILLEQTTRRERTVSDLPGKWVPYGTEKLPVAS